MNRLHSLSDYIRDTAEDLIPKTSDAFFICMGFVLLVVWALCVAAILLRISVHLWDIADGLLLRARIRFSRSGHCSAIAAASRPKLTGSCS